MNAVKKTMGKRQYFPIFTAKNGRFFPSVSSFLYNFNVVGFIHRRFYAVRRLFVGDRYRTVRRGIRRLYAMQSAQMRLDLKSP